MAIASYRFKKCGQCNGETLVDVTHTKFICKHCNTEQEVQHNSGSNAPAILRTYGDNRKLSREFADGVLNPIMSQRGANQNRRYG